MESKYPDEPLHPSGVGGGGYFEFCLLHRLGPNFSVCPYKPYPQINIQYVSHAQNISADISIQKKKKKKKKNTLFPFL